MFFVIKKNEDIFDYESSYTFRELAVESNMTFRGFIREIVSSNSLYILGDSTLNDINEDLIEIHNHRHC